MSNKKELHILTKELVKQMMNRDVDDVQDADYQIAYCYLAKALTLGDVSQQRELLIAYNVDFYKGIQDVTLGDIENNVDKYLSNL